MDFFTLKGSSKWDDSPDDEKLHSSLFYSPATVSEKKLKKEKTQKNGFKIQEKKTSENKKRKGPPQDETSFTNIKKPRQTKPQNGRFIHPIQVEDANTDTQTKLEKHVNLSQVADGQDSEAQSHKKKKKRKRKDSQGDGGQEGLVNKKGASNHDMPLSPSRFSKVPSTDDTHKSGDADGELKNIKKKRKRKPRNNKFKDAEGNVKPQFRNQHDTPKIKKLTPSPAVQHVSSKSQSFMTKSKKKFEKKLENKSSPDDKLKKSDKTNSQKKKFEKKLESKSSADDKLKNFEQAKKALKKRKRIRRRKRSVSESSNPEVESQNMETETKKLPEVSESDDSDANKNDIQTNQKGKSLNKLDRNPRYKVKRTRKKGKKQSQEDRLFPDGTEPKTASLEDEEESDDEEDEDDHISVSSQRKGQTQRSRLEDQLRASHFRFLNETFYQCSGSEAYDLMTKDKDAFQVYHEGYSQQVQQWPVNPVDAIIKYLKSKPSSQVVGDFGCGEAQIAQTVKQKVHSFDLCALNKHVTVCDIAQVPLDDESLDVAVFCLSLMGTNWIDYVKEANRVLKTEGTLKVAEVASRFQSLGGFLKIMKSLGFHASVKDLTNKMFYMFEFTKRKAFRDIDVNKGEILKPCLYKKR